MPISKALRVGKFIITSEDIAPGAVTFADIGTIYSSNITENSNLFFSNARATAAVEASLLANLNIAGNLVVDSNVLYIDSVNNRVGVGTTSPSVTLDVRGNVSINPNTASVPAGWTGSYDGLTIISNKTAAIGDGRVGETTALLLMGVGGDVGSNSEVSIDFAVVDSNSVLGNIPQVRIGYSGATNPLINTSPDNEAEGYFRIATRTATAAGILVDRYVVDGNGNTNIGSGSLYINAVNNRVGIGTSSPVSKLTVSGDVQILSTNYLSFSNTAQQTYIRASATNTLAFGTNSTQAMTLDANGNLVIGSTSAGSPSDRLGLVGGNIRVIKSTAYAANPLDVTSFSGAILVNSNNGSGDLTGLAMYVNSSYTAGCGIFAKQTASTTADLLFYTGTGVAASNVERVRITSGGNVGIGTTSPDAKLNIVTNNSTQALKITSSNDWGNINTPFVDIDGNANGSGDGNILRVKTGAARADVEILEVVNGNGTQFLVRGDGSVRIGSGSSLRAEWDTGYLVKHWGNTTDVYYQDINEGSNFTVFRYSMYMNGATAYRIRIGNWGNGSAIIRLTAAHWTSSYCLYNHFVAASDGYDQLSLLNQTSQASAPQGAWSVYRPSSGQTGYQSQLIIEKSAGSYNGGMNGTIEIRTERPIYLVSATTF